jgi:hypothetical protein
MNKKGIACHFIQIICLRTSSELAEILLQFMLRDDLIPRERRGENINRGGRIETPSPVLPLERFQKGLTYVGLSSDGLRDFSASATSSARRATSFSFLHSFTTSGAFPLRNTAMLM